LLAGNHYSERMTVKCDGHGSARAAKRLSYGF